MTAPPPSNPDQSPTPAEAAIQAALIAAAQTGDVDAIEKLLEANLDLLRSFIRRRLGSKLRKRETSQDLAQSVCREVLGDLSGFEYRGEGSFENWLMACAENKIRNRAAYWNRDRRDMGREELDGLERLASFTTPSRHMTTQENLEELEAAFRALSPSYQQVILLARVDGLPHEEVAIKMGRSVSSVQNLLYRALGQLTDGLS